MRFIHSTSPSADPLKAFDATGASFLPLADGQGGTHISCLHLSIGGKIDAPSVTHAAALLIVHGRVTIEQAPGPRIHFSGGMGAVFEQNEPYTLKSETDAIILIVESQQLTPPPPARYRLRKELKEPLGPAIASFHEDREAPYA